MQVQNKFLLVSVKDRKSGFRYNKRYLKRDSGMEELIRCYTYYTLCFLNSCTVQEIAILIKCSTIRNLFPHFPVAAALLLLVSVLLR